MQMSSPLSVFSFSLIMAIPFPASILPEIKPTWSFVPLHAALQQLRCVTELGAVLMTQQCWVGAEGCSDDPTVLGCLTVLKAVLMSRDGRRSSGVSIKPGGTKQWGAWLGMPQASHLPRKEWTAIVSALLECSGRLMRGAWLIPLGTPSVFHRGQSQSSAPTSPPAPPLPQLRSHPLYPL